MQSEPSQFPTSALKRPRTWTFRPEEIQLLIKEMHDSCIGARIEKIYDHGEHAFLIFLRKAKSKSCLLLSFRQGYSRFNLVDLNYRQRSLQRAQELGLLPASLKQMPAASETAKQLRIQLLGAVLENIDQPGGDRIARFQWSVTRDQKKYKRDLLLEMFGQRGRFLVIEHASKLVLFHQGRGKMALQSKYRFPDSPPKTDKILYPFDPQKLIPDEYLTKANPFHSFLASELEETEQMADAWNAFDRVDRSLARERKRIGGLLGKVSKDLQKAEKWEQHQRLGELLKASFGKLKRGMSSIKVQDYYQDGAPEIEIDLEARLDPSENIEKYFKRARKGKRGLEHILERKAELEGKISKLDEENAKLSSGAPKDWISLEQKLIKTGLLKVKKGSESSSSNARKGRSEASKVPGEGAKRFRSRQGFEIICGRSSKENDAIRRRFARGNDLFFHIAFRPGPHVILKVPKGKIASTESIGEAAYVAAHYSGWRGPGRATVHWTEVKHVGQAKGAPAGQVLISRQREFVLDYDPDFMKKLSANSEPGSP